MVDDYACAQRGGNISSANSTSMISSSNRTSRRAARAAKLHRSVLGDQRCAAPRASVRFDRLYNETADKLKTSFGQRARLSRTSSLNASLRVANDSLAFLHLDARDGPAATSGRSPFVNADVPLVGFSSMLDDITAWWPKLCAGGMLVGHDWTLAVPLNQRGQLRRGRWTPKHPVAYAVRRFLRTLEAKAVAEEEEEDDEEGEEEAPEGFWKPNKTRTASHKNNSVKAGDLEAYKKAAAGAAAESERGFSKWHHAARIGHLCDGGPSRILHYDEEAGAGLRGGGVSERASERTGVSTHTKSKLLLTLPPSSWLAE